MLKAALLACDEGSVVFHGTAAAFWGLQDQRSRLVDVTVACQTGRKIDGIRCRPWYTEGGAVPVVRSEFEAMVLPRLIAMGLPRPACNKTLRVDGEQLIVDFLWEDRRVVVETDGAATTKRRLRSSATENATRSWSPPGTGWSEPPGIRLPTN